MKNIFIILMCVGMASAQELFELPESFNAPIPEESRFDGPMPGLPEWGRPMTDADWQRIDSEFGDSPDMMLLAQVSKESLDKAMAEANETTAIVEAFNKENGLDAEMLKPLTDTSGKPMEIVRKPDSTIIDYQGGMYMDLVDKNMVVCVKDVKVRGPEFNLDCETQLQIYFKEAPKEEKEEEKKPAGDEKKDNPFGDVNVDFDGVEKAVAFGKVYLEYKDKKDGKWYQAHGERVTYNGITGEVILSGGYPYIKEKSGDMVWRTSGRDDTIRYLNGVVTHVGAGTATGTNLRELNDRTNSK